MEAAQFVVPNFPSKKSIFGDQVGSGIIGVSIDGLDRQVEASKRASRSIVADRIPADEVMVIEGACDYRGA